jgi:hypothetical protein
VRGSVARTSRELLIMGVVDREVDFFSRPNNGGLLRLLLVPAHLGTGINKTGVLYCSTYCVLIICTSSWRAVILRVLFYTSGHLRLFFFICPFFLLKFLISCTGMCIQHTSVCNLASSLVVFWPRLTDSLRVARGRGAIVLNCHNLAR